MNWSNISHQLLKCESVRRIHTYNNDKNETKASNNLSFIYIVQAQEFQQKLRCQSTYCETFGNLSNKEKMHHDILNEFPQHKKQRLTEVIVKNLKKNPLPPQASYRNILLKQNNNQGSCSNLFIKKIRDQKHHEQESTPKSLAEHYSCFSTRQKRESQTPLLIDQLIEQRDTGILSSPSQSPRIKIKKKNTQFILKQTLQKPNPIEKLLTETKPLANVSCSPRGLKIHTHKKNQSSGVSAYTEQNKYLRKVIGRSQFFSTFQKQQN